MQKIYGSLQQQSVNHVTILSTITELVVVWSVYNTCTVNQSFLIVVQILMQCFTLLLQMLQGVVDLQFQKWPLSAV